PSQRQHPSPSPPLLPKICPFALAPFAVVANVGWPAAAAWSSHAVAALGGDAGAALPIGQLEAKRTGHRIGFGDSKPQLLAQSVGGAGLFPDQLLGFLVVAEIFLADGRDRDQPV